MTGNEAEGREKHVSIFQAGDWNTDRLFTLQLGCIRTIRESGVVSLGKHFSMLTGRN